MVNANEFINGLKRDKARGTIAPHQIVLLLAFYKIFQDNTLDILTINIQDLNNEFQKVWSLNKDKFSSKSNILGMPLKALYNQKYIEINIKEPITDFRNISYLQKKINFIKINSELVELFQISDIETILKKRLTH